MWNIEAEPYKIARKTKLETTKKVERRTVGFVCGGLDPLSSRTHQINRSANLLRSGVKSKQLPNGRRQSDEGVSTKSKPTPAEILVFPWCRYLFFVSFLVVRVGASFRSEHSFSSDE